MENLGAILLVMILVTTLTVAVRSCTKCEAAGGVLIQGHCVKAEIIKY